ncbi:O-methyltransferase 1, chloroplastic-like protein [Drosera capensis]
MKWAFTLSTFPPTPFHKPFAHLSSNNDLCPRRGGPRRIPARAKLNGAGGDDDPLVQSAVAAATLRYQETLRPDPLFVDPYVSCMVPSNTQMNMAQSWHCHCLATKFIDEKLLEAMGGISGPRQVVLLTDGMDTRPYRLNWPNFTVIYDVSPERVYSEATRKLKDIGACIPSSCLLIHVPAETFDIQQELRRKGFNGARPSLWAIQGLPLMTLTSLEDVLCVISSLSIKETLLFGELPSWLADNAFGMKSNQKEWINKLFLGHGFRADAIEYEALARSLREEPWDGDPDSILFAAEHLRLSDDQGEIWRREFHRIEENGDEEGFEEL